MSTATWKECAAQEQAEFGTIYRTSVIFHEHAFPLFGAKVFTLMPRNGSIIAGGRVKVHKVEDFAPGGLPAEMRGTNKPKCWGVRITWEKVAEGTPVVVLAGAIIAVMVAAVFLWIVAAKTTEKQMHQVAEDVQNTIKRIKELGQETLFNPGFLVAAMVVAVIALRRR